MGRVIDINVRGVFVTTQAALKHMKSGSRIIMIGSAVGERVAAPRASAPYAGTKGSRQDAFTQALAREIEEPGHHGQQRAAGSGIDTELNPASGD